MLQHIKKIYGTKLNASDGDIGEISDFYFNDQTFDIRYAVADTGTWLSERQVLLSLFGFERLMFDRLLDGFLRFAGPLFDKDYSKGFA